MKIDKHLVTADKLDYVKGKRPSVDCILCSIRDKDKKVTNLEVFRNELFVVSLNLYPYNPGHLMVFPLRHLTDIRQFSEEEVRGMHQIQQLSMDNLDRLYQPAGFNLGYNIGNCSGASIDHLHCHIVPRYKSEIGLVEMVSCGTRMLAEDPVTTLEKLKKIFNRS